MEKPDIKYFEEPLLGLCEKPMHEMSEAELRDKVQNIRTLRTASQTFRARLAEEGVEKGKQLAAKPLLGLDGLI